MMNDLKEILKAIQTLKIESDNDKLSNPNYLENKFVTDDGFQVGYYVSKTKQKWYLVLEKYGTDNTIFIPDFSTLETAFNNAKREIELIKIANK